MNEAEEYYIEMNGLVNETMLTTTDKLNIKLLEAYHQSRVKSISDEVSKLQLKILESEETFYDERLDFILEDLKEVQKLLKQ